MLLVFFYTPRKCQEKPLAFMIFSGTIGKSQGHEKVSWLIMLWFIKVYNFCYCFFGCTVYVEEHCQGGFERFERLSHCTKNEV